MPPEAVMLKAQPGDDRPATMRDVRRAYRRNFIRFVILLALLAVLCVSFFLYTRQQDEKQAAGTHRQCVSRLHAVKIANHFEQEMARLEESNRFIDKRLRDERVALYRGLVYPLPHC